MLQKAKLGFLLPYAAARFRDPLWSLSDSAQRTPRTAINRLPTSERCSVNSNRSTVPGIAACNHGQSPRDVVFCRHRGAELQEAAGRNSNDGSWRSSQPGKGEIAMATDEFMKQQFLTLRDEIRESKARIFWLLIIGIVLVMVAGYLAAEHPNAFANAAIPFLLLGLMLSFISEQNNIARAGRYLRESVEPQIENSDGLGTLAGDQAAAPRSRSRVRAGVQRFVLGLFCDYIIADVGSAGQKRFRGFPLGRPRSPMFSGRSASESCFGAIGVRALRSVE